MVRAAALREEQPYTYGCARSGSIHKIRTMALLKLFDHAENAGAIFKTGEREPLGPLLNGFNGSLARAKILSERTSTAPAQHRHNLRKPCNPGEY